MLGLRRTEVKGDEGCWGVVRLGEVRWGDTGGKVRWVIFHPWGDG